MLSLVAFDTCQGLAFVRGEGGDVDQADDVVGIGGSVGDHRASVGVADGIHWAGGLVEQALAM